MLLKRYCNAVHAGRRASRTHGAADQTASATAATIVSRTTAAATTEGTAAAERGGTDKVGGVEQLDDGVLPAERDRYVA